MPSPSHTPLTRRSRHEAREEALEAARSLLLEGGPSAVTLQAVGKAMGVGHANLIHHFGSAAGLQGALMDRMVRDLATLITEGLADIASGSEAGQRQAIDVVFDAFDSGGAAQLAAWLVLARETERAESFAEVVRDLADRTAALRGGDKDAQDRARRIVMTSAYMAFADALIGPALRPILDLTVQTPRDLVLQTSLTIAADAE